MAPRLRPWRCGRCNVRIVDLNWSLETEQVNKCHRCREDTYNVLRIVVVRAGSEEAEMLEAD
jgi:hypothetical protein